MGRELFSRVTTQIPCIFCKTQALSVLRPSINAGSRLSLTTMGLNPCVYARKRFLQDHFHPPPRPVLSSSGSLHWGCVCTYPFTGNHYTKNILKHDPICQVHSGIHLACPDERKFIFTQDLYSEITIDFSVFGGTKSTPPG